MSRRPKFKFAFESLIMEAGSHLLWKLQATGPGCKAPFHNKTNKRAPGTSKHQTLSPGWLNIGDKRISKCIFTVHQVSLCFNPRGKVLSKVEPPITDNLRNYSILWSSGYKSKYMPICRDREEEDCWILKNFMAWIEIVMIFLRQKWHGLIAST